MPTEEVDTLTGELLGSFPKGAATSRPGNPPAAGGAQQPRLGGRDARTLYVTALTSVYRIRLQIPGIRPPPGRAVVA